MARPYHLEEDGRGRPVAQIETPAGTDTQPWKGENNAGWVAGDKAHDAVDAGNPVKVGGKASASKPAAVANGDRVNAWLDEYGQIHVIVEASANIIGKVGIDQTTPGTTNGVQINAALPAGTQVIGKVGIDQTTPGTTNAVDTELPAAAALGDGSGNPTTPLVGASGQLYNGSTWDRQRGNLEGVLLANQARTETVSSADQTNYNGRGIHVILDVIDITDTPSIILKIEGKSASGKYYTLLEGAAVTGTGTHVYKVMPWAENVANVSVSDLLPRTWRVTVAHDDADSITYSVDFAIDC